MDKIEAQKELEMSHDELTGYFQNKYGVPARAYFRTESCKTKSPITRGNEGLYIHHIKETEVDDLSQKERAAQYPWEYQLPHNLCYCNYLEHLLLHIHINAMRCKREGRFVIDGVLNHIIPELNHIYIDKPVYEAANQMWRNKVREQIEDNYDVYLSILEKWLTMIDEYNIYNLTVEYLLEWRGGIINNSPKRLLEKKISPSFVQKEGNLIKRSDGYLYKTLEEATRSVGGKTRDKKKIEKALCNGEKACGFYWRSVKEDA